MQHQPECQAAVRTERDLCRLADVAGKAIKVAGQDGRSVVTRVALVADGNSAVGMEDGGGFVRSEGFQPLREAGYHAGEIAHALSRDVLLIEVVLLEQSQPLELGVGLGKR